MWPFKKDLESVLEKTKTVKIEGVRFIIKRINVLSYLDGSKVLRQVYETYKSGNASPEVANEKKIKEHMAQTLFAGVVSPKLSLKDDGNGIFIDKLFYDWNLVNKLYEEIVLFSYGKKKI